MLKILTKSDICLIIFFIIIAIFMNFILSSIFEKVDVDNGMVVVYVNNSIAEKFNIDKNGEYIIKVDETNSNTIRIQDGSVKMIHATCSDKLCLYQPAIAFGNESIVCLPHKLIVLIENVEFGEIDSIVQ